MRLTTVPDTKIRVFRAVPVGHKLYVALALYCALLLLAAPLFLYLLGPDVVAYISIARHYATGDWADAVNTYWSPLVSWLTAPLVLIGIPGLIAFKIVGIFAGAAALLATVKLARGFEISSGIQTVIVCTAALMIASYSLTGSSTDVLVLAIALFYFKIILDHSYEHSRTAGILCGLLGALGFYAKAYIFCFFLVHFTAITVLRLVRQTSSARKRTLLNYLVGVAVFFAGCTPWLVAMHAKTGTLSLGTTGAWNYRMVGPKSPGFAQYYHLIPPPNPQAISMWEAPSPDLLPAWHPLISLRSLEYQLKLIVHNCRSLRTFLLETSLFSFAAIFAYLVWGISSGELARYRWPLVFATVLILPSGYLLISVEGRYVWPALLIVLLMGAVAIDAATRSSKRLVRSVAITGYALSFALFPMKQLVGARNGGKALFLASSTLRDTIPAHSRMAACGSWNSSLALAYYLNLRFYGSTGATSAERAVRAALIPGANPATDPPSPTPAQVADSLRANHISYYLVWPACRVLPPAKLLTAPIALPGFQGVRIFRVAGSVNLDNIAAAE
ncbi:MAG: hypothetical protein ACRD4Q_10895 [Candidatus Acidiferrales bacterium]